jgi:putative ABC transport system substrate-binding protein
MSELGWTEGSDYVLVERYAENVAKSLPDVAAKLLATHPDVVLTTAEPPALAIVRISRAPVVFTIARDPVATGLARSLQRPGGTATGLVTFAAELSAKRVQLLREAFPGVSHVAAIFATDDPVGPAQVGEIERAARGLGLRFTAIPIASKGDIDPAFGKAAAVRADGIVIASGVMTSTNREPIVRAAARQRIPAIYPFDIFPLAGGLMSYGTRRTENYRRAAAYVDKILAGQSPAEIPIEQPTTVDLVVNLTAARNQGLVLPQAIVLRADRVIQ